MIPITGSADADSTKYADPLTGVYTYTIYLQLPNAGSCLVFNRRESDYIGDITICLDEIQMDQNGVLQNGTPLPPGAMFDARPAQFNMITVQVSCLFATSVGLTFGLLSIADAFYLESIGASSISPIYTVPASNRLTVGQTVSGGPTGAFSWAANPGGSGIFSYMTFNPATLSSTNGQLNYTFPLVYSITNIGSGYIYLSPQAFTDPTILTDVGQTFPIVPGQTAQFQQFLKTTVSNPNLFILSADPAAGFSYQVNVFGV